MIEPDNSQVSIRRQCELVGLNRGSYYYQPDRESELNLKLMNLIDEQYTELPFYGWRRMTVYLRRMKEYEVNSKRVRRLMRLMGLQAVYPEPRPKTQSTTEHKIYPYLLRNLAIVRPNQAWSTDGRPFGRLVNISLDMAHHQGWVSSPWRLWEPSSPELVSFQGTSASREAETDRQKANVQERMGWG